jgi:Flp pilus assembly protein TadG
MGHKYARRPGAERRGEKTTVGRFLQILGLDRALNDARGGVMITFAVVFPVLLLILGSTIDYGFMLVRKTSLQASADAAALAGANELLLANADETVIESLAYSTVMANLGNNSSGVRIATKVSFGDRSVTVNVRQSPGLYIMDGLAGVKDSQISAEATAGVAGEKPICMLMLEDSKHSAIDLNKDAQITGNNCAVFSNSTDSRGINVHNAGTLKADLICSAGGFTGGDDSFAPMPVTDCPQLDDPLAMRPTPKVDSCLEKELEVSSSTTLKPGTYCGGLVLTGSAEVKLEPGIYVIQDGPLTIAGNARLWGENVGFYLTGDDANFKFGPNTMIELSAPEDGDMAGILFFEDPNSMDQKHTIRSNGARSLVGTFYMPNGALTIDATKPLFDRSAYTVIIAKSINMFSGPNLVLNTNYSDSDVPLPPELENASAAGDEIALIH